MKLTDERKATLIAFCRLDDLSPEDEMLLESFYQDAVAYMTDAGVAQPEPGSARAAKYDHCVNYMVLDSWDNREMLQSGTVTENPAFRRRLNQLKHTEIVSDSDTVS